MKFEKMSLKKMEEVEEDEVTLTVEHLNAAAAAAGDDDDDDDDDGDSCNYFDEDC